MPVYPIYPSLTIICNCIFSTYLQFNDYIYNCNSSNYIGIINYPGNINWNNMFSNNSNINDDLDFLYSRISFSVNKSVSKTRRHKLSYLVWFSRESKV